MAKTGRPAIDLVGRRFERLVVIARDTNITRRPRWICRCDCGREKSIDGQELRRGKTRSCRCLQAELLPLANRKHGDVGTGSGTPEWNAWASMRKRCTNSRNRFYRHYGGRGITVCERWNTYENFLVDMGRRPSPVHSLDRKDNNGNYEPDNCRWATKSEQAKNQRPKARQPDGTWARGGVQ